MSEVMNYTQLKERLDQIVEAVDDETLSLDDALTLYEEAVKLGSRASALIESDINAKSAEELEQSLAEQAKITTSEQAGTSTTVADMQIDANAAAETSADQALTGEYVSLNQTAPAAE